MRVSKVIPKDSLIFETIDLHTGGEPLRVVLSGVPDLHGANVLASRRILRDKYDHIRTTLMYEPRGHSDMYGCILTPPNDEGADFGVVFIHNEGYSTMCGHAIIALGKLAVLQGWVPVTTPSSKVTIDAPCGRIDAKVDTPTSEIIGKTSFEGVPSYLHSANQDVNIDGIGKVEYDLAYGGAYYAYVDAGKIDLSLEPKNTNNIIDLGMRIKEAVIQQGQPEHPFEADLSFLYGTIFIGGTPESDAFDRNVCVFAEGEVDRSPTGSGVSGRVAILHAKGELNLDDELVFESISGSTFSASANKEVRFGPYNAVIPTVTGEAWITGSHRFYVDRNDPFKNGFLLR